jgi:hypothetical protein
MEENRRPDAELNMTMRCKCPKKDEENNEMVKEDMISTNKKEMNSVKRGENVGR